MQILFAKDLGKNFKLKYRRWLCMDFLFSSVCMSHCELSDFVFSAICQPIRPSRAGWLVELIVSGHPIQGTVTWQSGASPVTWYSGPPTVWYGSQGHSGNPLRDRVVWFWLLNLFINNNTTRRPLSYLRSYCTCISKISDSLS